MENFEFLLGMIIWYDILFVLNTVSKSLQKEDMQIAVAINQLRGLMYICRDLQRKWFCLYYDFI